MRLAEIIKDIPCKILRGEKDSEINGLKTDSRLVEAGDVFIALTGLGEDGHKYIESAALKGASFVVADHECESFGAGLIVCEDTRIFSALLASAYYENAHKELKFIGVTGTNGKTTVTHIIKTILELKGCKTGLIGTNHCLIGEKELQSGGTTPEAIELHSIIKKMKDEGCEYVVMEVSSHALSLFRCYGITFEVGIFTNLTEDHLNYHKDLDDYAMAKSKLFSMSKIAVLNEDDSYFKMMKKQSSKVLSYGIKKNADMKAENIEYSQKGVSFDWCYGASVVKMRMAIPGEFSVYNALSAIGAGVALGLTDEEIKNGILLVRGVKGRAEVVHLKKDYTVMIDYAHTPDGIENILKTVKGFAENRVIIVFGCGGDRDSKKRPIMGEIAAKYADFCVVTSDNPRTEKPQKIVEDILLGMKGFEDKYKAIVDRTEAISYALSIASKGDVVLLAGKGHETYQDINGVKIHYDEREVLEKILKD